MIYCPVIYTIFIDIIHVTVLGDPPKIPNTPSGPTNGDVGQILTYSTRTTDPDGDQVYYKWNWGDGEETKWLGPYDSGQTVKLSHTWTKPETYSIKVKAKDTQELESDWSEPLDITIPRNRAVNRNSIFFENIKGFIEYFPILFRLVRALGG